MKLWILWLASGGLLASGLHAAAVRTVVVPAKIFNASWNDRIKTSGGDLLGLMWGEASAPIPAEIVTVRGIDAKDKTICVNIRQISGAYSAYFEMKNPQYGREVGFILPRQKISARGLPAAELAILARASSEGSCADKSQILPASWGASSDPQLFALVNDNQADRSRTVTPARGADCKPLTSQFPGKALNVYQVACSIPVPTSRCGPQALAIRVDRGGKTDFIEAVVRLYCP